MNMPSPRRLGSIVLAVPALLAAASSLVGAAFAAPQAARAGTDAVAVAAASDLQTALPEALMRYQATSGAAVTVSFGSSGNLFAQIDNGAPFDVFLSADIDYPRRLIANGRADRDSLYVYALGRLVLWTRTDTGIDVERGLSLLRDARVRRIAIANPALAPYGRAAVAALRHDGLYDAVKDKLVLGDNIAQAAQFADSGNADVGLIALSLARGPALAKTGTFFLVPPDAHPPIVQAAVVVSASRNKAAAHRLLAYLRHPETVALLDRFGFTRDSGAR